MEEYWMIYALAASLCVGLFGFAQKMKSQMQNESDNGFVFYTYIMMGLSSILGPLFLGNTLDITNTTIIGYAFIITALFIVIVKTRLEALRYLSSSAYFINYRIISSLWLLFVGVFLFSETISFKEVIGICLGFIIFYLLLEKNTPETSVREIKKGFFYLLIGTLAVTGIQGFAKDFITSNPDIFTLVLYQGIFGIFFVMLFKGKEGFKSILTIHGCRHFIFLLLSGIVFAGAIIFNNLAFIGGDLAIVYKIVSYSLFIPIILSIIIYKERISGKKLIAFILTLISIFLFI